MWKQWNTKTSVSQFGTSVVRTKSDRSGVTISRIHKVLNENVVQRPLELIRLLTAFSNALELARDSS